MLWLPTLSCSYTNEKINNNNKPTLNKPGWQFSYKRKKVCEAPPKGLMMCWLLICGFMAGVHSTMFAHQPAPCSVFPFQRKEQAGWDPVNTQIGAKETRQITASGMTQERPPVLHRSLHLPRLYRSAPDSEGLAKVDYTRLEAFSPWLDSTHS